MSNVNRGSEWCDGLKWFDFHEHIQRPCSLPLPLSPPITLKANVLQRDIHPAKSSPADIGRALCPRRRRLLVSLYRRAVVGRLVPLDSRPHDRNWPHEFCPARGTRPSPFPT